MKKISSTLNAIDEEIIKDIKDRYGRSRQMQDVVIKNILVRDEYEEEGKSANGLFFEIESIVTSNNNCCYVDYYIIEIMDKKNINGMIRMMSNMEMTNYSISQNGRTQVSARSGKKMCVVNYQEYGIETEEKDVKEINVSYHGVAND